MSAKTLLIATVALATTALTALPSVAAPSQPGPPAQAGQASQPGPAGKMPLRATIMFALIDRNGDGSIQKEELDVVRDAIFASLDTNSDGQLSKDELGAIGPMFGPGRGPGPDGHDGMHRHHDRGGQWQGQNDDRRGPPHDRQGQMGPPRTTSRVATRPPWRDTAGSQQRPPWPAARPDGLSWWSER